MTINNKYVIREISADGIKDVASVELITNNTSNTWQHNRQTSEKADDTLNGKIAEDILYAYMLEELANEFEYIPYDVFRTDDFKKHAPFDALFYKKDCTSPEVVKKCIQLINAEILNEDNPYGKISTKLRNYCFCQGIYTIEVKSTRVNKYKLNAASDYEPLSDEFFSHLVNAILEDDYITYPYFCRDNHYIESFDDYIFYVKKYILNDERSDEELKAFIIKTELEHSSDIFVRVYLLNEYKKAIILGYTTKYDLFLRCNIGKCPSKKSKNAIYYKQSLKEGKDIKSISDDLILWNK